MFPVFARICESKELQSSQLSVQNNTMIALGEPSVECEFTKIFNKSIPWEKLRGIIDGALFGRSGMIGVDSGPINFLSDVEGIVLSTMRHISKNGGKYSLQIYDVYTSHIYDLLADSERSKIPLKTKSDSFTINGITIKGISKFQDAKSAVLGAHKKKISKRTHTVVNIMFEFSSVVICDITASDYSKQPLNALFQSLTTRFDPPLNASLLTRLLSSLLLNKNVILVYFFDLGITHYQETYQILSQLSKFTCFRLQKEKTPKENTFKKLIEEMHAICKGYRDFLVENYENLLNFKSQMWSPNIPEIKKETADRGSSPIRMVSNSEVQTEVLRACTPRSFSRNSSPRNYR